MFFVVYDCSGFLQTGWVGGCVCFVILGFRTVWLGLVKYGVLVVWAGCGSGFCGF